MARILRNPRAGVTPVATLKVHEGGTSATVVADARANLDMLFSGQMGQANGAARLPADGILTPANFSGVTPPRQAVSLEGTLTPFAENTTLYKITNFDITASYTISATGGTISRSGDTISYVAGATTGPFIMTVNGKNFPVTIIPPIPVAPTLVAPVSGNTSMNRRWGVLGTAFTARKPGDALATMDVQIATDAAFANIAYQANNDGNTSVIREFYVTQPNTTFYVRARYRGTSGLISDWSAVTTVATRADFNAKQLEQEIVSPDPAYLTVAGQMYVNRSENVIFVTTGQSTTQQGKVFAFVRAGFNFVLAQVFTGAELGDTFGGGIDGSSFSDYLFIPAASATVSGLAAAGLVYIYVRSTTSYTWTFQQVIQAPTVKIGAYFGAAISASADGTKLVVTSIEGNGDGGRAYHYARSGTTWSLAQTFRHNDVNVSSGSDLFGVHCCANAAFDRIVISAPNWGASTARIGAVYLFSWSGSAWSQTAKFIPPTNTSAPLNHNYSFGARIGCVITSGGIFGQIYVSWPNYSGAQPNQGAIVIFSFNTTTQTWDTGTTFAQGASAIANSYFGYAGQFSPDGNNLWITHSRTTVNGFTQNGRVERYARNISTGVWSFHSALNLPVEQQANSMLFGAQINVGQGSYQDIYISSSGRRSAICFS